MARPHIEPYIVFNEEYKAMTIAGLQGGSEYKVLSMDTDTGACSLTMRFNGGYTRKPGLSYSDMEIFVLSGEMKIGDEICKEGHFMFVPAGYAIGAIEVPDGAEALVFYNNGEPSFEESDEHHDLTLKEAFISMNGYTGAPWINGSIVNPATATGIFVKVLRFDPLTEAFTFLYTMSPQCIQDNISYHDCAEESYHVWGTSWIMQFGDIPTGGYFWRPPYINHGSFRSELGCIALGRTDSKLHNYFHYDPWSTTPENQSRAAAHLYRQRPELYQWVASEGHNHPHGPSDHQYPDYQDDPHVRTLHGHGPNQHHGHSHSHDHDGHSHSHGHDHSHGHTHDHDD